MLIYTYLPPIQSPKLFTDTRIENHSVSINESMPQKLEKGDANIHPGNARNALSGSGNRNKNDCPEFARPKLNLDP
jgi:hypothetical protein